jgi:acyl-CoA synthetase (AMP-forming)/AMP-acid ligase II
MPHFLKRFSESAPALFDGDTSFSLTYGELLKQIFHCKNSLNIPKALVFLFCSKACDEALSYFSLMESDHVVCLLDKNMRPEMKERLIDTYEPELILDQIPIFYPLYEKLSYPLTNLTLLKRTMPSARSAQDFHPSLKLLLSTSGTTGSPKMIRLSMDNLIHNAASIIEYLEITPMDRAIASLPFHYSYGLSVLNTHLLAGASLVTTSTSLMQKEFWDIMNRMHCTSFAGVPYMYHMLERIGFDRLDLPNLKTMTQAGGRLDPLIIKKYDAWMKQKNGRFFVMYGQSEATARMSYVPPSLLPEKAHSIGCPIPGGMFQIWEGENLISEPKHEGEIVYTGRNVMLGYAETRENLTKGDENIGILHTGDLGYFDSDGLFYLTGRMSRFSKIYGLRINLDEVEIRAKEFGCAAVIGNDTSITIYIEKGTEVLCQLCAEKLAAYFHLHPSTFICRSAKELPLLPSGKIDYHRITQWEQTWKESQNPS